MNSLFSKTRKPLFLIMQKQIKTYKLPVCCLTGEEKFPGACDCNRICAISVWQRFQKKMMKKSKKFN